MQNTEDGELLKYLSTATQEISEDDIELLLYYNEEEVLDMLNNETNNSNSGLLQSAMKNLFDKIKQSQFLTNWSTFNEFMSINKDIIERLTDS